ncbi:MAG: tetratricopeptide repeat protein [Nitrospira sp.]|nr:tetratricopeptide repeat protein [Nitrospira sp.]
MSFSAVRFAAVAVLVAVLGACAQPVKPITAPQGPAKAASPTDPILDIQGRLLQEARTFHAQGRYESAIRTLQRLLKQYPQPSSLAEAHWWLARSYEQAGNTPDALVHYRDVAQAAPSGSLGLQARQRVAELEQALKTVPPSVNGRKAVFFPSHRLPAPEQVEVWVRGLAQAGVTTVVHDAGMGREPKGESHGRNRQPPGVFFQTHWADTVRDVVGQLVPVAHRQGLAVFCSVTLRQMPWLEPQLDQLGWADRSYDPARGQLVSTDAPDLFHPAFQEYLVGLLSDLAAGGIDGILFKADQPSGPADGFSPFALKAFERDFGIMPDPATFVASSDVLGAAGALPDLRSAVADQRVSAPEFWRWAGWKSRETLKVMDRLRQALRKQSPNLQFALEVHPEAITDPVTALTKFNEDLLEAKRIGFDAYVMGGQSAVGTRPSTGPVIADRMIALLGSAGLVWVALPVPLAEAAAIERLAEGVKSASDRARFAKGIGLLYVVGTAPTAGSVP